MTDERTSGRGCFKLGCFGCAGLFAGVILISGAIVALGLIMGRPDPQIERPEISTDLPPSALALPRTDVGGGEFPALGALPATDQIGRIELDLTMGSFEIVAGEPGEPPRVDGRYDAAIYRLDSSHEARDDGGWVWKVEFSRKVSWMRLMFGDAGEDNRIRVVLPPDRPFVLAGDLGIGEFGFELGGLWIVDTVLEIGTGEYRFTFDDPLQAPMRSFLLDGGIGELTVSQLGNASPSEVHVEQGIGETQLNLRGAWRNDAEIALRCGIGECGVTLPDQAAVDLGTFRVWLGEADRRALRDVEATPDDGKPVLSLDVTARLGEVRLRK